MRLAIFTLFAFCFGAFSATTVTNVTVGSGGGYNYTTLSSAEDGEDNNGNLVTRDTVVVFNCYGFQDTTAVTFNGWTTDATRYIVVTNVVPHGGKWNASAYNLTIGSATALANYVPYIRFYDIQISINTTDDKICLRNYATSSDVRIARCIFRQTGGGGYGYYDAAGGTTTIFNTLAFDIGKGGFAINHASASLTCYNCTTYQCATNAGGTGGYYRVNGSFKAVNCLAVKASSSGYDFAGTFVNGTDYNASDSTLSYTVTGGGNTHDRASQTFTLVDAANRDLHLASNDAGARDYGTPDPSSGLFSDDIDKETRSGSWDIGADEYVAAGGATAPKPTYLLKGLLR